MEIQAALVYVFFGFGVIGILSGAWLTIMAGVVTGTLAGASLGPLLGALISGLTGPEIERQTIPNQGVRRSARNVWAFAPIGGLTVNPRWYDPFLPGVRSDMPAPRQ